MPDQAKSSGQGDVDSAAISFRLVQLEVFNWGPFRGFHRAEFDPRGTAIIGPTGSGKTTLVDALMTLLVAQPKYNLASTGGHESDRTLFSYVRGVLGGDGSDGREEVSRPGKTFTGICATYDADGESLRLGALFWIDGPSNSAEDLRRRWIFSQSDGQSLELWLQQLHEEGARELSRTARETASLRIFDAKAPFLTHLRKFFDVGENAFTLLNRAAGLKQLNSIDEIFRDLVLDDRSAFDRAVEVAGEFDNLAGIHTELEKARHQQESLLPIAREHEKLQKERQELGRWSTLKRINSTWFAILGSQRWRQEVEALSAARRNLERRLEAEQSDAEMCRSVVNTLRERYLQLGGNTISHLEKAIVAEQKLVSELTQSASDYRRTVAKFGLSQELTPESLHRNQAMLRDKSDEMQKARESRFNSLVAVRALQQTLEEQLKDLTISLKKVRDRPTSNIPPRFQDFRADLALQLSVPEQSLPFLAEMVEVRPSEAEWRGAIERAIGPERLRVLIPEEYVQQALRWVNQRHNQLHVRLQEAIPHERSVASFNDGYVRKLNFKSHSLQATAKRLLSERDRHCVRSVEALRAVEHGLTAQGMMSGRRGSFDKHDQKKLEEDWMTGFDNKDQLDAMACQLQLATESLNARAEESRQHGEHLDRLDQQLKLVQQVLGLEFARIDLPGAEVALKKSQDDLALLLAPRSDASQAKAEYDKANGKLQEIEYRIKECDRNIAVLESRRETAETEAQKAEQRAGGGLQADQFLLAEQSLSVPPDTPPTDLAELERGAMRMIDKELGDHGAKIVAIEKGLIRFMEAAKRIDSGALTDVTTEIDDISHYLNRLRVLTEEALPEKRARFLDYLNRSSDQGVTQLLAGIDEEIDAIEQRIQELNQTLVKIDFRSGRYLQLQPQRIKHESLRSLESAIRKVRSAALKADDGESHYRALRELVEILREAGQNRTRVAARALLDPRYRLQFFVVEVDRQTGSQSPRRTGSQSGSGGEKELMASHILTASLSYALCPAGVSQPLYGTVILDEAFSKSSPSAASRIIEALRVFRLHPIFVTPNKEIGLLKQHTRKVICVQRPGKESSLASISWEKLDELARGA